MRVNVMHAGSVPAVAFGHEHWRFRHFMLFVCCRSELSNLKGAHLFAVDGVTVLGKAEKPPIVVDYAASGAGNALVAGNDGAGRMLGPVGSWIVGGIERERVMLVWCGTGKQPPFAVAEKDGRIGVRSG